MRIRAILAFLLCIPALTSATTRRVPADFPTIQAAVNASVSGDEIRVYSGIYVENITINDKAINVTSVSGSGLTTIRAANTSEPIVRLLGVGNQSEWSGFTLTGSNSNAILVDQFSSPIIKNCVFHHFPVEAVIVYDASPVISRNIFYQNTGISCIGIFYGTGTARIYNNTFDRNARGFYSIRGSTIAENNIVYMSRDYGIYGSYTKLDYNDVYGCNPNYSSSSAGPHDISVDPKFVDTAGHDYTLRYESPCINAGDPDPSFDDIDGTRCDMGAVYSGPPSKPVPTHLTLLPGILPMITSPTPTITWKYAGPIGTNQTQYEIEVGSDADWTTAELWSTGPVITVDSFAVYDGLPLEDGRTIHVRIRLHNEIEWGDWSEITVIAHFFPIIRVPSQYTTIQGAITVAFIGDTILVAPGTYNERIDFMGKAIWVESEAGASVTTIHSPSAGSPVVRFDKQEVRSSVLHGFKVEGAISHFGVYCSSTSPTIEYCEITGNTNGNDGAGIWINNGAPLIQYNKIYSNASGGSGGGIGGIGSGGIEVQYNEIYNNTANAGGGIGFIAPISNAKIHHNVVRHNPGSGTYAGGIYVNGSNLKIYNNTVVYNSRGITLITANSSQIFNNIVAYNTIAGIAPSSATISYNDTYSNPSGNSPGTNGISADPLFQSPSTFDYRLSVGSPCINAGDPNPAYNDPDGSIADIGAFNTIVGDIPLVIGLVARPGAGNFAFDAVPTFHWYYYDTTANPQAGYEIEIGSDSDWVTAEIWSSGQVSSADTSALYGGAPLADGGPYWLRIRVNNGVEWGGWCTFTFSVKLPGPWRVPLHSVRISDLLPYVITGDTIVLSPGTYSDNFSLSGKDLVITSDSGSSQTILQSATLNKPIAEFGAGVGRNTILERISVRGGRNAAGIQITGASPTIRDCEVTDNQGPYGGIGLSSAGPQIIRCDLHHNTSTNHGAGIGGTTSLTVEIGHNLVHNNSGTGGGGVFLSGGGGVDVHHNIIYRNIGGPSSAGITSSFANGAIRNNTVVSNIFGIVSSSPVNVYVVNNIVLANLNDGIVSGSSTVDFNDTWNNGRDLVPSKSNINADPKFRDTLANDFSLLIESPCIDAGDPSPTYFDPDGSRADMGALPRDQTGLARVVALTLENEVLTRVVSQTPTFSWNAIFPGGMSQQAFEVQVGGDPDWEYAEYWEPGIVTSTDTSVAYSGEYMRDGMLVYSRVRVFDGTIWTSWYNLTFHMDNRPGVPALDLPVDTNVVNVNKPQLSLLAGEDKDGDPQQLVFEVYRDSLLQNIRVTSPLVANSAGIPVVWTVTAPLLENLRYWWRARSFDGYTYSIWSSPRSFWINQLSENPTVPVLTSPIEQAEGPEYDLTPAFVWGEGDDPDPKDTVRYTVQISLNDTFTLAFTYPDLLTKTFVENDSLPVSIHFWWRVMATDREGHSAMSLSGQFTTYSPGDVDHSGYPDLADLALMIDYLYISRSPFSPLWAGDVDGDCSVDIADITRLIDYLYLTYYPLEAGCGVSASTGQQFLKKLGAEIKRERGKLPAPKAVTKPTVLAPTQ